MWGGGGVCVYINIPTSVVNFETVLFSCHVGALGDVDPCSGCWCRMFDILLYEPGGCVPYSNIYHYNNDNNNYLENELIILSEYIYFN